MKNLLKASVALIALIVVAIASAGMAISHPPPTAITEEQAYEIGFEAYLYFYPLVMMDVTRRQATNVKAGKVLGRAPMNTFSNIPVFPPAEFRDVVRPNFDTLYSLTWLDLTKGPIIVTAPDTNGRYYMLQMLDMWTDVFANPGKRSTGTKAGNFALVPPGWSGTLPDNVMRINSPTGMVWIIGRTQTNGSADYSAVHKIQAGYKLTKLSEWEQEQSMRGKMQTMMQTMMPVKIDPDVDTETPPMMMQTMMQTMMPVKIDPDVDMETPPMIQVDKMAPDDFFEYAAELMKINPPHSTDYDMVARLARIGIKPGKSFEFDQANPAIKTALERGAQDALKALHEGAEKVVPGETGWQLVTDNMGVYGNSYWWRALIALIGLGANPPEDAIYPIAFIDADGKPFDAANMYVLRFEKGKLPPADAFWSVTLYDPDGFPVANELERHALGDRDPLVFGSDDSVEIYIQANSPGKDKETNWLPAPKTGSFNLVLRLYAPRREALDGRWLPPGVQKVE